MSHEGPEIHTPKPKQIPVPTDEEFKKMEKDPNYIGQGVIRHEYKMKFKHLELTCVYHGDAVTLSCPDNNNRHAVKIKNLRKFNNSHAK